MLNAISCCLPWKGHDEVQNTLVVLDCGFEEALVWQNGNSLFQSNSTSMKILNLDTFENSLTVKEHERTIFLISTPLLAAISKIKIIIESVQCKEAFILTTTTAESLQQSQLSTEDFGEVPNYYRIVSLIEPVNAEVIHFPLHIIPIMKQSYDKELGMFILSSASCRDVSPLTLHSLGIWNTSDTVQSIYDISAADLPQSASQGLKLVSHELAAALVFNLGLDPTGRVFALGKSSELIGFNLQSHISHLSKARGSESGSGHRGVQILQQAGLPLANLSPLSSSSSSSSSLGLGGLESASLLLIDRTQDLFSPAAHTDDSSLAHRIAAALPQTTRSCQSADALTSFVPVDCATAPRSLALLDPIAASATNHLTSLRAMSSWGSTEKMEQLRALDELQYSFSALSGLPLPLPTSVCISPRCLPPPHPSNIHYSGGDVTTSSSSSSSNNNNINKEKVCMPFVKALENLQYSLMMGSEEDARQQLCGILKQSISACNGAEPPPKKRGLGAEILALTQSLISAPGPAQPIDIGSGSGESNDAPFGVDLGPAVGSGMSGEYEETAGTASRWQRVRSKLATRKVRLGAMRGALSHNPRLCVHLLPVLGVAAAVIEAMQRSSGKQLMQACTWKCSYDVRAARERATARVLSTAPAPSLSFPRTQEGVVQVVAPIPSPDDDLRRAVSAAVSHLLAYLASPSVGPSTSKSPSSTMPSPRSVPVPSVGKKDAMPKSKENITGAKVKGRVEEDPTLGPADVVHVILQAVRLFSLLGEKYCDVRDLELFSSGVAAYLKHSSHAQEILSLVQHKLLAADIAQDIIKSREFLRHQSTVSVGDDACVGAGLDSEEQRQEGRDDQQQHDLTLRIKAEMDDFAMSLAGKLQEAARGRRVVPADGVTDIADFISRFYDDEVLSQPDGVVARAIRAVVERRILHASRPQGVTSMFPISSQDGAGAQSTPSLDSFEHIGTAMQQLQKAGLDLLSSGLGRLGLGVGKVGKPDPAATRVLVVFVVGGISYNECRQVQRVVSDLLKSDKGVTMKIIIGSTSVLSPESILKYTQIDDQLLR